MFFHNCFKWPLQDCYRFPTGKETQILETTGTNSRAHYQFKLLGWVLGVGVPRALMELETLP